MRVSLKTPKIRSGNNLLVGTTEGVLDGLGGRVDSVGNGLRNALRVVLSVVGTATKGVAGLLGGRLLGAVIASQQMLR